MKIKELTKRSKEVISGKMKLEWFSRFYGSPVFKQSKKRISEEDVRRIQGDLFEKGIFSQIEITPKKIYLKVLRGRSLRVRKKYVRHLVLFLLAVITTSMTGALLRGKDPFASFHDFSYGFPYSFALLAILFCHEMGHYLFCKHYKVEVTLPYFIPFFVPVFNPGTLGAFIKIRSPIPNKRALFDIGVAGPLAGFVVSIIVLVTGFSRLPDEAGIYSYISQIHPLDTANFTMGNTLLYDWISSLFGGQRLPMNEMCHFPLIFAGWFGLLVTAINLMPIGQLDGGHITYAMFGDRARLIAIATFALLIFLNIYLISSFNSYAWVLWCILILFFIRFRHPPTLNNFIQLDRKRKIIGWLSYLIFITCFSPMPIS